MKNFFLSAACLLLLTGCFETDFSFKTTVKPNGSIVRETKIDGRGGDRFVVPSGAGWEVKTYDTKGGQSLLEDTYHHVHAFGRFKNVSEIGSDYQFNVSGQFSDISDEERKNFIQLGIVEPFEESIYSKNFIQATKYPGLFKSTYEYQEIFQNKGIVELLLNDIKKEVIREQAIPVPSGQVKIEATPSKASEEGNAEPTPETVTLPAGTEAKQAPQVTIEGQLLSSQVVESIARERMAKDTLSKFKFRSEVTLPGEIISSNADSLVGSTAIWQFSIADFESNFSRHVLTVRSQMIEWTTISLLVVVMVVIIFGISFMKPVTPIKRRSARKS